MFDIYIRVSRLGERTGDEATEVYEEQCLSVKDRLSLEIDEIVGETNVGGSVEVADRELERLIQKIENDESEGLIVPWTDRFARGVIEGQLAYRRIARRRPTNRRNGRTRFGLARQQGDLRLPDGHGRGVP